MPLTNKALWTIYTVSSYEKGACLILFNTKLMRPLIVVTGFETIRARSYIGYSTIYFYCNIFRMYKNGTYTHT